MVIRATLAASLLLAATAWSKPKPRQHVKFHPPDAFTEKGPAFFCYRDTDAKGKPTNTLVCMDYAEFMTFMQEHPEAMGHGSKTVL